MAIQTNKRKRKHEATSADQADDAEIAVPKKVHKESDTPKRKSKKAKDKERDEQTQSPQNEEQLGEEIETTKKKKKKNKEVQQVIQEGDEPETTTNLNDSKEDQAELDGGQGVEEDYERMDEDEISPDSGIEPETQPMRFPNDFKMLNFRSKLLGNNFITGKL